MQQMVSLSHKRMKKQFPLMFAGRATEHISYRDSASATAADLSHRCRSVWRINHNNETITNQSSF